MALESLHIQYCNSNKNQGLNINEKKNHTYAVNTNEICNLNYEGVVITLFLYLMFLTNNFPCERMSESCLCVSVFLHSAEVAEDTYPTAA